MLYDGQEVSSRSAAVSALTGNGSAAALDVFVRESDGKKLRELWDGYRSRFGGVAAFRRHLLRAARDLPHGPATGPPARRRERAQQICRTYGVLALTLPSITAAP